jgi:hypothetical protein
VRSHVRCAPRYAAAYIRRSVSRWIIAVVAAAECSRAAACRSSGRADDLYERGNLVGGDCPYLAWVDSMVMMGEHDA